MKHLVRLYPRAWRERYGAEIEALIERRGSSIAALADLARGLVDANFNPDLPRVPALRAVSTGPDLVLVPGIGFRPRNTVATQAHALVERDGRVLVAAVAPDRDGVRLDLSIKGLPAGLVRTPFSGNVRITDAAGQELHTRPGWQVGGNFVPTSEGTAMLHYVDLLEPIDPSTRKLVLDITGVAGTWHAEVPVGPGNTGGAAAHLLDASSSKEGITIRASAIARSSQNTAIEIEAFLDAPPQDHLVTRRISALNANSLLGSRVSDERLTLMARGRSEYLEASPAITEAVSGKHRETLFFDPLPPDLTAVSLEIPSVTIQEHTPDALTIAVPGEMETTIAGCAARITATRMNDEARGARIRVQVAPLEPSAVRQLLYMQSADTGLGIVGTKVTHCVGQAAYVDVPDPGGVRDVTLRGPVIAVRGPWHLHLTLLEV